MEDREDVQNDDERRASTAGDDVEAHAFEPGANVGGDEREASTAGDDVEAHAFTLDASITGDEDNERRLLESGD
jgi:hypothetical protein